MQEVKVSKSPPPPPLPKKDVDPSPRPEADATPKPSASHAIITPAAAPKGVNAALAALQSKIATEADPYSLFAEFAPVERPSGRASDKADLARSSGKKYNTLSHTTRQPNSTRAHSSTATAAATTHASSAATVTTSPVLSNRPILFSAATTTSVFTTTTTTTTTAPSKPHQADTEEDKNSATHPFSDDDNDDTHREGFDEDSEVPPRPRPKRSPRPQSQLLKQGWLSKSSLTGHTSKTFMGRNLDLWKKRWIVLRSDGISYFASEEDVSEDKKLGFVPLHTIFDLVLEDDVINVSSCVGRTLRLKAAKPELTQEWATILEDLRDSKVQSRNTPKLEESRALQLAEIIEHQVKVATLVPTLYRQGWLQKQGSQASVAKTGIGFGKSSWKRRWIVLNSHGLSYYESDEVLTAGGAELGFIPFDHNFAFTEVAKANTEEPLFTLVSSLRTVVFRAESKEDKLGWMQAMGAAQEAFVTPPAIQASEAHSVDLTPQQQAVQDKLVNRQSIREGYLNMQIEGAKEAWKSRYFVLLRGELTFYKHPKDPSPLGSFILDASSVVQAVKEQAFTFFVLPSPNAKQVFLSADGIQAQVNWLESFHHSVPDMLVSKVTGHIDANRSPPQVTRKSTRSLKEGFMLKQGQLNKTWKRRYFVLEPGSLEYFKHPHDRHSKGSITLSTGDVLTAETDVRCSLVCGSKTTNLSCESPLDLLAWLTAFQSIKHLTVITHARLRRAQSDVDVIRKAQQ